MRVVGHDIDGRAVAYDEERRAFHIGGVPLDVPRFARYARKGLVLWESDDLRAWFEEWYRWRLAAAARVPEAATDPDPPARAAPNDGQPDAPVASADFQRARRIGSEGERQVSKALHSLGAASGWHVLDDVLLQAGRVTAQIDHVIVDARGVVLVETKTMAATIMGREADRKWTACYGKRKGKRSNKPFQNPLEQNRYHESILLNVIAKAGWKLPPDYVDSLVVFVGSRLDRLELRTETRRNVVELADIRRWSADRMRAGTSASLLDDGYTAKLAQWLRSFDRSSSAEAQNLHQSYREQKRR